MAPDEAEAVTGSALGFLHFFDEESKSLTLSAFVHATLATGFQVGATKLHYDVREAGIWADCVRERRPVIHNDYMGLPGRKGVRRAPGLANSAAAHARGPADDRGHPVALANKDGGYRTRMSRR